MWGKTVLKLASCQLLAILFCLGLGIAQAGMDAPHTALGCNSCHQMTSTYPKLLPPLQHTPVDIDDTLANNVCTGCHNDVDAPHVLTHSSLQASNKYGDWSVECWTCHSQHSQDQFRTYKEAGYAYAGLVADVTTTTLTVAGSPWSQDQFKGYLLVPNTAQPNYFYKITGNTGNALTVQGNINLSKVAPGNSFAIFYGKFIRKTVNLANIIGATKTGTKSVKFFRATGPNSFADDDTVYNGICEVCHTQTSHFRNNGGGTDQNHGNRQGTDCIDCHNHSNGFIHGRGGSGTNCSDCHDNATHNHRLLPVADTGCAACHAVASQAEVDTLHATCAKCHGYTGTKLDKTTVATAISSGKGDTGSDQPCEACHTIGHETDTNILHNNRITTGNNADCASCHDISAQASIDTLHRGCATCHSYSGSKLSKDTVAAVISAGKGSGTPQKCQDCHTGAAGSIHHITAAAANANCTLVCHSAVNHTGTVANTTPCIECHANTAGTATGMPVSRTDGKVHGSCQTCHAFDADKRGILVDFTSQKGVIGTGTLPDGGTIGGTNGGGACTVCHTQDPPESYHHTSLQTGVGQCEYCHIDPRPSWQPTGPGDNGAASGLSRPTQMACRQCHVRWSNGTMLVTKFERSDYTSYAVDWTRTTVHTIPMTQTRINNFGICLSCHYQGNPNMADSAEVTVWHAHPSRHASEPYNEWDFYDQDLNGPLGKTKLRRSDIADLAHFVPGRSKDLAGSTAPQSFISGFNIFFPNYADWRNDPSKEWNFFDSRGYDTPAFTRIGLPTVPQIGNPASATLNATTRAVPVFASLAPITATPGAADLVLIKSATYGNGAMTVRAATSNGSGCTTLTATYGGTGVVMSGASAADCTATFPDPAYPGGGTTVDVTTSNPLGQNVLGYPIAAANPGGLAFSTNAYSAAETNGMASITVQRLGGASGAVGVTCATAAGGTATAGVDYTTTSQTLSWADGETADKSCPVAILNDASAEGNETVNLTLATPTGGASLSNPKAAVLTITDDENLAGSIAFSAASYTVAENGGTATVTVTRSSSATGAVSVDYGTNTLGSTAVAGDDYPLTHGTLSWADNESGSKTFTITTLNHGEARGDRKVNLFLNNVRGGATLGAQNTAVLDIISPAVKVINPWPASPQLTWWAGAGTATSATTYSIGAGTKRLLLVAISFQSTGGPSTQPFSATYGTIPLTELTIQNSQNRQTWIGYLLQTGIASRVSDRLEVTVPGNRLAAAAFVACYDNVNQNWPIAYASGSTWGSGTQVPGGPVSPTDLLVGYGGYSLYHWANAPGAATMSRSSDDEAYTEHADLLIGSNPNRGNVGIASRFFVSPAATNPYVVWSNPDGGAVSAITLNAAEVKTSIAFSSPAYSVAENGGAITLTVSRLGKATGAMSVDYTIANGTAVAGTDYDPASGSLTGTLTWAANDPPNKTITVNIHDNPDFAVNKTVNLSLANPTGDAVLGVPSTSVLTIVSDEAALTFSAPTYSVSETSGSATITIKRIGGFQHEVGVNYATVPGGTAGSEDFTEVSGQHTWPAGDTSDFTFTIPINDNATPNDNETVNLALSTPTGPGTVLGDPATAVLTIIEDETSLLLSAATYSLKENGGAVTVSVTRQGTSTAAASVDYATSDGTAMAGSDYTATSGTLTWGVSDKGIKTFSIPITNDIDPEENETLSITLTNPTGGAFVGNPGTAQVTVIDNDHPGTIAFSGQTAQVIDENDPAGRVTITATRSGGSDGVVSADVITGGTATRSVHWYDMADYGFYAGGLSWEDGDATDKTFQVQVLHDEIWEGNETAELTLANPTGGATLGSPGTVAITIDDYEDRPGTLAFATANYEVAEDGGTAIITVNRTGGYNGAASVHYETTSGGTASAGADYDITAGTLSWAHGETGGKSFTVAITNNSVAGANKTVNLLLSTPSYGVTLGSPSTAVLTIVEDEGQAGTIAFAPAAFSTTEEAGTASITVTRSGGSTGAATVEYTTVADGTAAAGTDFTPASGTLTWGDGQFGSKSFDVTIPADSEVEGNETFSVQLANPVGAPLGGPATVPVTIEGPAVAVLDPLPGMPQLTRQGGYGPLTGTYAISEGPNRLLLVAVSTSSAGHTGQDFTVTYGGKALTQATLENSNVWQTWIGYLNEADIAARTDNTISVTVNGSCDVLGVYIGSYINVSQTSPIGASGGTFNNANYLSLERTITPTPLHVEAGGYAVYNWSGNPEMLRDSDHESYNENGESSLSAGLGMAFGVASKPFPAAADTQPLVHWADGEPISLSMVVLNKYGGAEVPGVIVLRESAYSVAETAGMVVLTARRTGGYNGATEVSYGVAGGTAVAGVDYAGGSGTIAWANGDMADKTFSVDIIDNAVYSVNRTLNLALSAPTGGAVLGNPSAALVTINNDDPMQHGEVAFSSATYSVGEAGAAANITVIRSGSCDGAVGVNYATAAGGTAAHGSDFMHTSGSLSWADGDCSLRTISITIVDDLVDDGDKTVNMGLSLPTGGVTLGSQDSAVLTIVDNEDTPAAIALTSSTFSISENAGTAQITVRRSGTSAGPVRVYYETSAVAGGTAVPNVDFKLPNTHFFDWTDGDPADKSFTVTIYDNALYGPDKTVNLELMMVVFNGNAVIGSPVAATLTIVNDDPLLDADSDGVQDPLDLCPGTPVGQSVDANGCALSQLDTDGDGITDDLDLCPGTAAGQPVNASGCDDTDQDGVADSQDLCPATPAGETVDATGCGPSQLDSDGDGVSDLLDLCPGTPAGQTVDINGCTVAAGYRLPDSGQTTSYTTTFGEDHDYPLNPLSFTVVDSTVVDNNTGLVWQQQDDSVKKTWDEATTYCSNLTLATQSDWRLPTREELAGIFDFGRQAPAIDPNFAETKYLLSTDRYWTSTTAAGQSTSAWYVTYYQRANDSRSAKTSTYYVRCVRGGM